MSPHVVNQCGSMVIDISRVTTLIKQLFYGYY
jgi:hypothetical protein